MAQQKKNVGLGRGLGALISGSMLKHAQSAAFKNKEKHASSGPKKNVPETKKPTAAAKPAATTKKTAVPAKKNVATPKNSATPTKKTAAHATTKPSAATTKKTAAGTKSVAVTKKSPESKAPTKKTVSATKPSATKPSATKPSVVKPVATKKSPEPKTKKIAHAEPKPSAHAEPKPSAHAEPKPSAHAEPEISAPEEKISASEPRGEVVPAAATPTETVPAESTKTVPANESESDANAEREAEPSAESGTETTENFAVEPSEPSESVAAEPSEPSESVAAEPSEPSESSAAESSEPSESVAAESSEPSESVAPSASESAASSSVASASKATVPASESVAPSAPKTVPVPPLPFVEIFVEKIVPAPHQSRRVFEETSLRELAESIRAEGLLQPIVVREIEDGKFELIAGERRWRAFRLLKLPRIPARIVKASDASSAAMTLIENLQREDLNPIEEAFGIGSLMRDFNLTQDAVAERVGKARSSIANALRLLSLDAEIQGFVASGILSVGHAKVLLSVVDPTQRLLLARRFVETQCSVRAAEALARRANEGRLSPRDAETEPIVRQLSEQIFRIERELCSHFHTKVLVKNGAKSGKILIEYRGNDELSRLLDCFGLHGLI